MCVSVITEQQHHSLVVQCSADVTLTASASVQVVAQSPVFWLKRQVDS